MKQAFDNTVSFISGIFGSGVYILWAGIWNKLFDGVTHLLWVGVVAMFSGAMGVVGKRLVEKYVKRKSKDNE